MAINWTNEYESQPRQASDPGNIASSVRTLKTAIRERMNLEHYFGSTESTDYGKHREGSARVYVIDDESAGRASNSVSEGTASVGRVRVDHTVRSPQPSILGVLQTGEVENRIDVIDKDNTWLTLFDPDDFVSSAWDQSIGGRKVFDEENPEVQEKLDDVTYAGLPAPDKLRADEKAMKRSDIKILTEDAKSHNVFDASDDYNTNMATTGGIINPNTSNAETTVNNASGNVAFFNKVYGAVWN